MILNIKYKTQNIIIHCTGYCDRKRTLHLSGVYDDVKHAIDAIGLKFGVEREKYCIYIYKPKHLSFSIPTLRTSSICKVSELAIGEPFYQEAAGIMLTYIGQNKGYYDTKWGREIIELSPDTQVSPCDNVPIKQIKARLHRIDNDTFTEIWQSESENGKRTYFGRDTMDGSWCVLCDAPNGYCEPSHSIRPHIHIIVCDKQWNEIRHDGNNKYLFPESFPSLEKVIKSEWESIKYKYPDTTKDGLQDWLESMKPEGIKYEDNINWSYARHQMIDPDNLLEDNPYVSHENQSDFKTEILHTFQWLNEPYCIIRYAHQHTMCDARWYDYMAVYMNKGKVINNVKWLAYQFINQ